MFGPFLVFPLVKFLASVAGVLVLCFRVSLFLDWLFFCSFLLEKDRFVWCFLLKKVVLFGLWRDFLRKVFLSGGASNRYRFFVFVCFFSLGKLW